MVYDGISLRSAYLWVACTVCACGPSGTSLPNVDLVIGPDSGPPSASNISSDQAALDASTFTQRPEWNGPCAASPGAIDVNLGNSPESFVQAAYCQINGSAPSSATVSNWANQLRTVSYLRRIDVVRSLCKEAGNACALTYSDPWVTDVLHAETCVKKTTRDVGAVMMFFFTCPGQLNCGLDWANTHAWGMKVADAIYATATSPSGYYAPTNAGFWLRELLDARYAGMQFVLPNVFGYDIQPATGEAPNIEAALTAIDAMGGGMKVGLFNDTWAWGQPVAGPLQNPAPDLSNTEAAAQAIYNVQWKPFFQQISRPHWYTINGAPLIYFYNAGTLTPASGASAVILRMKQLFQQDFGVTPFVDVDRGYGSAASADAQFTWDTFSAFPSTHVDLEATTTGGLMFANSMVKWDSVGRDTPGAIATATARIFKGPEILSQVLQTTAAANVLLIETWNDLGEGTGITRNYDYYENGSWLPPDAFMNEIRASQCSN